MGDKPERVIRKMALPFSFTPEPKMPYGKSKSKRSNYTTTGSGMKPVFTKPGKMRSKAAKKASFKKGS